MKVPIGPLVLAALAAHLVRYAVHLEINHPFSIFGWKTGRPGCDVFVKEGDEILVGPGVMLAWVRNRGGKCLGRL